MTSPAASTESRFRFGLADLLCFTTESAVILAFASATGPSASIFLVAMALALVARFGVAAVIFMLAAQVSAEVQRSHASGAESLYALLLGLAVLGWHRLERFRRDERAESRTRWEGVTIGKF